MGYSAHWGIQMTLKRVHYTELLGNRWNVKPRLEMLSDDGYVKVRMVNLERQIKSAQEMAEVVYDRSYVIGYFARTLELLRSLGIHEVRKIIGEALKESKQLFNE